MKRTRRAASLISPIRARLGHGGSFVVRDALPDDVSAIAEVYAYYVIETVTTFETVPPNEDAWLDQLRTARQAGHPFLVGTLDSAVVGYAYVNRWKTKPAYARTVENSIYLAPDQAGHGHGRALLDELLVRAAAAGAREVIAVIADTGNPASAALHRSAGFTDAGRLRRVGFKHGRWIDTVLLQHTLETVD